MKRGCVALATGVFGVAAAIWAYSYLPHCLPSLTPVPANTPTTDLLATVWGDPTDPRIRSAAATRALTDSLAARRPRFLRHRHVTVLYPGAGTHLAVLEIAHRLIDTRMIDSARFIFTEVDTTVKTSLRGAIDTLVARNFYASASVRELPVNSAGSETEFRLLYRGKPVLIALALNRSRERYWLPDYARSANIIYRHDIDLPLDVYLSSVLEDLFADSGSVPEDGVVLFQEGMEESGVFAVHDSRCLRRPSTAMRMIGTSVTVRNGFGHRSMTDPITELRFPDLVKHDERGDYRYLTANAVFLDGRILRGWPSEDYRRFAAFQMIAAAGFISPTMFRLFDATDTAVLAAELRSMAEMAKRKIETHTTDGTRLRAEWLTALIRLSFVTYLQSGTQDSLGFSGAFAVTRDAMWIGEHLSPGTLEHLAGSVAGYGNDPLWHSSAADFLAILGSTLSSEVFSIDHSTQEWLYGNLSPAVRQRFLSLVRVREWKGNLGPLLCIVQQVGRLGIGRDDLRFQRLLQQWPNRIMVDPINRQVLAAEVDKSLHAIRRAAVR